MAASQETGTAEANFVDVSNPKVRSGKCLSVINTITTDGKLNAHEYESMTMNAVSVVPLFCHGALVSRCTSLMPNYRMLGRDGALSERLLRETSGFSRLLLPNYFRCEIYLEGVTRWVFQQRLAFCIATVHSIPPSGSTTA